jgi:hypothetical protein
MQNQADTLRVMMEKYLRLARTTDDPQARSKYLNYAAVYAELSGRSERRQTAPRARDAAQR